VYFATGDRATVLFQVISPKYKSQSRHKLEQYNETIEKSHRRTAPTKVKDSC